MKIKIDFITNSSSASFYIMKDRLTEDQILMIYNHINLSHVLKNKPMNLYNGPFDGWRITQDHEKVMGDTTMDNFNMLWFLTEIGIKEEYIHYESNNI